MFVNEFDFDSYGCPPPVNIMKRTKNGFYSECQIQKIDSYCAANSLYVLYLTNIIGFKNAVLSLYYQLIKIIETFKQYNKPPKQQSKISSLPPSQGEICHQL